MMSSLFERPNRSRNQYFVSKFATSDLQCYWCSKKFFTIRGYKNHINVIHDKYNLRINLLNYVDRICRQSLAESTTTFLCWKCNKTYQYNEDRVQHFIACHFASFLPADNVLDADLKSCSTSKLSYKSRESLKCWKCEKQFKSQRSRLYHFVRKHARTILSNNIDPSNSLKREIEKEQMIITDQNTSVSTVAIHSTANQLSMQPLYDLDTTPSQPDIAELSYTRNGKLIFCLHCKKKFRSTGIFKRHVNAKHSRTISFKTGTKSKSQAENIQNNACNTSTCSQYAKQREDTVDSIEHLSGSHIESALSIGSLASTLAKANMIIVQDKALSTATLSSCLQNSENCDSASDFDERDEPFQDQHHARSTTETEHSSEKEFLVKEKQIETEESTTISHRLVSDRFDCQVKPPSTIRQASNLTTMDSSSFSTVNTEQCTSDPSNMFSCWQCPMKFKTVYDRITHYIDCHIASILSHSDMSSSDVSENIFSRQEKMAEITVSSVLFPKQCRCWSCTQSFQSHQSLITHFIEKHANFILLSTTDPIDILKNEIATAKQKMETSCTNEVVSSNCPKEFEECKFMDTCSTNIEDKHVQSYAPVTTLTTKRITNEEMVPTQVQKNTLNQVTEPISSQHNNSSVLQLFDSTNLNIGSHERKVGSDLSINPKSASSSANQSKIIMTDQGSITGDVLCGLKKFPCWACEEEYKSAYPRLNHFLWKHSELFLPNITVSTNRFVRQRNNFNVSVRCWRKSRFCWECGKEFKCYGAPILHFVEKHAQALLSMDTDPSDALRNQIAMAQERMSIEQYVRCVIRRPLGCSKCSKTFATESARSEHFNAKHYRPYFTPTPKILNYTDNKDVKVQEPIKATQNMTDPAEKLPNNSETQGKMSQEYTNSIALGQVLINVSYYCEQCDKEFLCAADHLEHFQTNHTEAKPPSKIFEEFFANPTIMQCPKAKSSTIVYFYSGLTRQQIYITSNNMNRCPYESCHSKAVTYDFEEFWFHMFGEHKDMRIKLECCNPMIIHTPEEYKNHILHL